MTISKIFKILVPKDKKFTPLFESASSNVEDAAKLLIQLFTVTDKSEKEALAKKIKELEKVGDNYTHSIFDELNKTFITPFDREDVYNLNSSLDDILDYINACAQKVILNNPKEFHKSFLELSELILQACIEVHICFVELKNLKNPLQIKKACIKINEIENLSDDIYHNTLSDLFANEKDAIELIKKRDILNVLEEAVDKAEDIADALKTIIVKMA